MSLEEVRIMVSEKENRLQKAEEEYIKNKVYNEAFIKMKIIYDNLIAEKMNIKKNAYNSLGQIRRFFATPNNPPLHSLELDRINQIDKQIKSLGYKFMSAPIPPTILKDEIAKLRELVKKKELMEDRIIKKKDKEEAKKRQEEAKRKHEKAFIASAIGKTRDGANLIKRNLRKQIKEFPNCPYCSRPLAESPHCDHIYPVSHGGLSTLVNMVYICNSCNLLKRDLTLREFIDKNSLDRDKVEENLLMLGKKF